MLNEAQMAALDETIRRLFREIGRRRRDTLNPSQLANAASVIRELSQSAKILMEIKKENTNGPESSLECFIAR